MCKMVAYDLSLLIPVPGFAYVYIGDSSIIPEQKAAFKSAEVQRETRTKLLETRTRRLETRISTISQPRNWLLTHEKEKTNVQ